jgi:hypothetical protein
MSKLRSVEVSFETPDSLFGIPLPKLGFKGNFEPDEMEQNFAWAIYIELTSRVTLAPLAGQEGSLRETLTSYYSVFKSLREQLRQAGPRIGRRRDEEGVPLAATTVWLMNGIFRPLLAQWHPRLSIYEEQRPSGVGAFTHEAAWEHGPALRNDLAAARAKSRSFTVLYETVCDIRPSLIPPEE